MSDYSSEPEVMSDYNSEPEVIPDYSSEPEVMSDYNSEPEVMSDYSSEPEVILYYNSEPEILYLNITITPLCLLETKLEFVLEVLILILCYVSIGLVCEISNNSHDNEILNLLIAYAVFTTVIVPISLCNIKRDCNFLNRTVEEKVYNGFNKVDMFPYDKIKIVYIGRSIVSICICFTYIASTSLSLWLQIVIKILPSYSIGIIFLWKFVSNSCDKYVPVYENVQNTALSNMENGDIISQLYDPEMKNTPNLQQKPIKETKIIVATNDFLLGLHSTNAECGICLNSFIEGNTIRELNCGHIFHDICSYSWISNNKICPMCKQKIYDAKSYCNISSDEIDIESGIDQNVSCEINDIKSIEITSLDIQSIV